MPDSFRSTRPAPPSDAVVAFSRANNVILVPVSVSGTPGLLGADTGAPLVVLNPASFAVAPPVGKSGTVRSLSFGATRRDRVGVVSLDQATSPDPAVALGGLLGCTVLCDDVASFDYRGASFSVGPGAPPPGTRPPVTVPFSLEGGGVHGGVALPRSRIMVDATIEGRTVPMMLDTGASEVLLRDSLFSTLARDGRAVLGGATAITERGPSGTALTRVRSMTVGPVRADGVVVVGDPAADSLLDDIGTEIGRPLDGLVGGTFLHAFHVSVDYARHELRFAAYRDVGWLVDPARRLGFVLERSGGGPYSVATVFQGSDAAAKGVAAGDVVLAIDGTLLSELTVSEVDVKEAGAVGATHAVRFGTAQSLGGRTIDIRVDDLLPL